MLSVVKGIKPRDQMEAMLAGQMAAKLMHLIVTEYGILGGLAACGVIYATSLVMDRYGL